MFLWIDEFLGEGGKELSLPFLPSTGSDYPCLITFQPHVHSAARSPLRSSRHRGKGSFKLQTVGLDIHEELYGVLADDYA